MYAILMMDSKSCIGIDGNQPLHLVKDLQRFKELTSGKTVIYGSKTLKTFPGQKPLPNRNNIIISKTLDTEDFMNYTDRNVTVYHSIDDLICTIPTSNMMNAFVIGGASIYMQLMPFIHRIYLTQLEKPFEDYIPSITPNNKHTYLFSKAIDNDFNLVDETIIDDVASELPDEDICTKFKEYVRI